MFDWLMKWWRARQRRIDMQILWPACKQVTDDLDCAKAAFFFHVARDAAWTKEYTTDELVHFVDELS